MSTHNNCVPNVHYVQYVAAVVRKVREKGKEEGKRERERETCGCG